ncbi:MAG: amidophosphoribosyltransferase [Candidatus Marinimicrobia bacterium]|nr:amidophosphoribosyltransferase [Candidatus Neomarinimicrobiota bacterium]
MQRKKSINEKCGVFGIYGHDEASTITYHGLFALQHRGQESSGIVSTDGKLSYKHLGMGLVADIFSEPKVLEELKGHIAIGHNRYSTTGASKIANIQPLVFNLFDYQIAISHNGNLVNTASLRKKLMEEGTIFQTTTDTELIIHLMAKSKSNKIEDKIRDALNIVTGAYSMVLMTEKYLIAVRDPHGFRPLCVGKLGDCYVFASESCAFDLIEAEYIRDVKPGEIIIIDEDGLHSFEGECTPKYCIFEYVYFSRPDSRVFGEFVDKTRRQLGRNLADEADVEDADIVISVPDSSNTTALGYASRSGKKFEIGLIRNHYVGRTFINPRQDQRDFGVKIKFNTVGGVLKDKKVIVVDDSIVRGTTLKKLTKLLKNAGCKEIHVRISSPPIKHPCYYGLDFPSTEELIAGKMSVDEIKEYLGVDSLHYLSTENMLGATSKDPSEFCSACFTGEYPIKVNEKQDKEIFEN